MKRRPSANLLGEAIAHIICPVQLSYAQIPRRCLNLIDLKEVFRFVAPQVRNAAIKTADQLNRLGVRHALAGGLAVGAHGYIRATVDVDFLVGEEAFEHQGSLVAFKAGVPIEVDGIRIAYLSPISLGPQLEEVLDHPPVNEGLAIVPIEVLIYMKLMARRRRDLVDIIELVKAGADVNRVREYLRQYANDLLPSFEELVEPSPTETRIPHVLDIEGDQITFGQTFKWPPQQPSSRNFCGG